MHQQKAPSLKFAQQGSVLLETMIAAQLLGVDAFDQPAVEEGKILAKRYIAEA